MQLKRHGRISMCRNLTIFGPQLWLFFKFRWNYRYKTSIGNYTCIWTRENPRERKHSVSLWSRNLQECEIEISRFRRTIDLVNKKMPFFTILNLKKCQENNTVVIFNCFETQFVFTDKNSLKCRKYLRTQEASSFCIAYSNNVRLKVI